MKEVLIISYSDDYHVKKIKPLLKHNNINYYTLYLDKFPKDYSFTQLFKSDNSEVYITHLETHKKIKFSDIGAVWLRKPSTYSYLSEEMESGLREFADQETEHALFSALYCLDCFWISHPKHLRAAMWKGEQLQRASQFGFQIPNTIISQNASDIRSFYLDHNKVVYKAMASSTFIDSNGQEQGVATTLVDQTMLENTDSLSLLPNQFQEYIDKAYELRVTIIGEQVFAAKLDSQAHEETQVDCRNLTVDIPMSAYTLPSHIEHACLSLVKSYELNYSALDLIVTPRGEYIFLENNPNGQFMFVEEKVPELGISNALINTLQKACQ
ncbi:hypothetical protein HG263_18390 [Pseudoalteromonas sp. JBTF-M23]|uniref:MvdD-like pre-ATP grasp domain-containing protein n=1 Tax=Pseudoalteromonas caenipelagi TaxID=2726988 RepID=A0A849VGU0_9GAMM|nr:hypothetical protein [Pseudoalteromonas caenipelagi]NOU52485.1 hypothetical protein [Pseudoalteromonas caenipelagi]